MKNQTALQTVAVISLFVLLPVAAEEATSAMAAPKCDLETIQALCGEHDTCVKVEKGAWEGGYNVTTADKESETAFLTEVVIKKCM